MFGDFAAWAYAYIAGVTPLKPGFEEFEVRPRPPAALGFAKAKISTPHGAKAHVVLPSGKTFLFGPGRHSGSEGI